MKSIPTIFEREQVSKKKALCVDIPNPLAGWVFRGEGVATRKMDGTACMVKEGKLYKRYDGSKKPGWVAPPEFVPADDPTGYTDHATGWMPVGEGPDDARHREAWLNTPMLEDGTYELVGPKVNGNPEGVERHILVLHGAVVLENVPTTFVELRAWLAEHPMEGIVWHHPDGMMAKIKRRDFDLPWPVQRLK